MSGPDREVRPIPGYEGHYSASECGLIWSHKSRRFLRATVGPRGYYMVDLYVRGKRKMSFVHRLIAAAFVERHNSIFNCVNHIDFDKLNNKASNLEWTTQKANLEWSRKAGRMPITEGMRRNCARAQRIWLEKMRTKKCNQTEAIF